MSRGADDRRSRVLELIRLEITLGWCEVAYVLTVTPIPRDSFVAQAVVVVLVAFLSADGDDDWGRQVRGLRRRGPMPRHTRSPQGRVFVRGQHPEMLREFGPGHCGRIGHLRFGDARQRNLAADDVVVYQLLKGLFGPPLTSGLFRRTQRTALVAIHELENVFCGTLQAGRIRACVDDVRGPYRSNQARQKDDSQRHSEHGKASLCTVLSFPGGYGPSPRSQRTLSGREARKSAGSRRFAEIAVIRRRSTCDLPGNWSGRAVAARPEVIHPVADRGWSSMCGTGRRTADRAGDPGQSSEMPPTGAARND